VHVHGKGLNVESAYRSARDRAHSAPLGKACMSLIISVIELQRLLNEFSRRETDYEGMTWKKKHTWASGS